ncbi:MAG: SMP-30/gluconolactonase/LRE family protein [Thermoguttaceae bacterium]
MSCSRHMFLFVAMMLLAVYANGAEPVTKPFKAIELGDGMLHPDGMTVHPQTGDIILAVPVIGEKGDASLLRIDSSDKVSHYFTLPAHPETGRATPLGIAFGPDGHLYVADSQCLGGNPNHKSRILRVIHDGGKPVRCETVIEGLVQANGLDIHNGVLYVAETQIEPSIVTMPMTSGVFAFTLSRLDERFSGASPKGPLRVEPYGRDSHFIFRFETSDADRDGAWKVGANGLGLTQDGKLYVANFGDKELIEVSLDNSGKSVTAHHVVNTGGPMESIDGIKIAANGIVFFADYVGNAVVAMNPANGKSVILAKNPTNPDAAAKKAGALDRCSEVCLRGDKLYVANIDLEDNSTPHTIGVIDLKGIDLDALLK